MPYPYSFRQQNKLSRPQSNFQSNSRSTEARFLDNTCWKYNKRGFCGLSSCTFQHKCSYCRGSHNAMQSTNTMVTESNINLDQPTHSAIQTQISTARQVTPQENLSVNPLQQLKQTNRNILSHPVTPIKVKVFQKLLKGYDAQYLISGFWDGFRLGYNGPREAPVASNLKSCRDLPEVVADKIQKEVSLGCVKGPFLDRPTWDLRISPIGVVPKKVPGQYRLIHYLSHPKVHQ